MCRQFVCNMYLYSLLKHIFLSKFYFYIQLFWFNRDMFILVVITISGRNKNSTY